MSQTDDLLKAMVANPTMIAAYKAGIPGNGQPFPDGSKIVKIKWKPKKSPEAPFDVRIPDVLQDVFMMEKDSRKYPNTKGWAYAVFNYDRANDSFVPNQTGTITCGFACPTRVANKDYIFTPYGKRRAPDASSNRPRPPSVPEHRRCRDRWQGSYLIRGRKMERLDFIKAGITIAGSLIVDFPTRLAPRPAVAQTAPSSSLFAAEHAMKFINFAKYMDLDRIAGARPAHFAYADQLRAQGKLAIGGPLLDDQGRRIGLLFVYQAVSRDAALALVREDPFTLANALRSYEITEWRLRGVDRELLIKSNRSADQSGGKDTQLKLFANYAKYGTDKSRLASVRPAHWEYDRKLESAGRLALAGPFASDEGGLFVYHAAGREEALSFLEEDPFAVEGVFAHYELLEWIIEGVNPDLLTSDF